MTRSADRVPALIYARLWQVLVEWFRVPDEPPAPPARPGEPVQVFRPSPAYLSYRKFKFWILLTLVDVPLLALWIWTLAAIWWLGLLLAPVFVIAIVAPDIVAYVAIHLHYDTMWYAMSPRSLRIRHGVWLIREMTITFENVQNVNLSQGPLERRFGIARVMVQTAGGGSGQGQGGEAGGHQGLIEGVDNAPRIRDLIMDRVRRGGAAGLGDEAWGGWGECGGPPPGSWSWTPSHLDALRAARPSADSARRAAMTAPAPERGLLRVLLRWLRAPETPPELPDGRPESVEVFLPAPGYLRYLRWEALVTGVLIAAAFAVAGLVLLLVDKHVIGWLLLGAAAAFLLGGSLLAVLARLRWRMMWYALGERALRARHGLWTIHEVTITYENVQNVEVAQGPLMRLFGIWKLDIMTAGGARRAAGGNPLLTVLLIAVQIVASFLPGGAAVGGAFAGGKSRASKQGVRATGSVYGLLDPLPVRNRIMEAVRRSRSAGLGDEGPGHERAAAWARRAVTREHVVALRSILDLLEHKELDGVQGMGG